MKRQTKYFDETQRTAGDTRTLFSRWLIGLALASGLILSATATAETMTMGGTGSALGTMRLLAESYKKHDPSFSLTIVPSLGSSGGTKALVGGAIDLAVISRPLKSEETAQGLVAIEYGRTPFVLVTNRKDVSSMTLQETADIVGGKVTRWPDGSPIRLVLRPTADYDTGLLGNFSPEMKRALNTAHSREGMVIAVTDQDSADAVERLPGAFGTSSLALILSEHRKLYVVPVNGVQPSPSTLADNSYPYMKVMCLVTKGPPSATAQRFIDYVGSTEGRALLAQTGHWVSNGDGTAKHAAR